MGYSIGRRRVVAAAAAALLLHCWWVPGDVGSSIVGYRNRDVLKDLELLEFVVRNDQAWRFVLNQQVRLNGREGRWPAYHDAADTEVRRSLNLIDDGTTVTSPLPVVKRVLRHHRWFGSHIEYAVHVLNAAFVCTTVGFLQVQIELVVLLMTKEKKAAADTSASVDDRPVAKGWELVVQFADKVAAVHGSLQFLSDLAYEYVQLALEQPDNKLAALQLMAQRVDAALNAECVGIDREAVILEFSNAHIKSDCLYDQTVTDYEVNAVLNCVTAGMADMFDRLNAKTMPPRNWAQILDFGSAVRRHIDAIVVVDENYQPVLESKEAATKAETEAAATKTETEAAAAKAETEAAVTKAETEAASIKETVGMTDKEAMAEEVTEVSTKEVGEVKNNEIVEVSANEADEVGTNEIFEVSANEADEIEAKEMAEAAAKEAAEAAAKKKNVNKSSCLSFC